MNLLTTLLFVTLVICSVIRTNRASEHYNHLEAQSANHDADGVVFNIGAVLSSPDNIVFFLHVSVSFFFFFYSFSSGKCVRTFEMYNVLESGLKRERTQSMKVRDRAKVTVITFFSSPEIYG